MNGYAYNGAPKTAVVDPNPKTGVGLYDSTNTTLTLDNAVFERVGITQGTPAPAPAVPPPSGPGGGASPRVGTVQQFTGFRGIQFQNSNSLDSTESDSIFKKNIYVQGTGGT